MELEKWQIDRARWIDESCAMLATHPLPSRRVDLRSYGIRAFLGLIAAVSLSGCGNHFATDPYLTQPSGAIVPDEPNAPRALFMFEGSTGRSLGWADVMAAASAADAIFIGERHDDPTGHAVQLAVYSDLLAGYPGTAIALEHLERNEQVIINRYLAGEVSVTEFIDSTKSRDWAGEGSWVRFFQPLVDEAMENDAPVVGANAPRSYVRRARDEGRAALEALPPEERANFDLPITTVAGWGNGDWNSEWQAYNARFRAYMAQEGEDPDTGDARVRLDTGFLSQSTWDGTMGASVARALDAGAPKVVLCAGCFHIEHVGGTVLQFRARRPHARVLTITVIDSTSSHLRDEDRNAADVVMYGFPVSRKAESEAKAEVPATPATPQTPPDATTPPVETSAPVSPDAPITPTKE